MERDRTQTELENCSLGNRATTVHKLVHDLAVES